MRKILTKGSRTRDHLVQKAIEVFAERGYYQSKVEHIVSAAGLAKGTVYQYFRSKDEIYHSALDKVGEDIQGFVVEVLPPDLSREISRQEEFEGLLCRSLRCFFDLVRSQRELFSIFFSALMSEKPEVQERARLISGQLLRAYDVFYQNSKNQGYVRSIVSSRRLAAWTLHQLFATAFECVVRSKNVDPHLSEELSAFILGGLRATNSTLSSLNAVNA